MALIEEKQKGVKRKKTYSARAFRDQKIKRLTRTGFIEVFGGCPALSSKRTAVQIPGVILVTKTADETKGEFCSYRVLSSPLDFLSTLRSRILRVLKERMHSASETLWFPKVLEKMTGSIS